jgi:hypothetical protein
MNVSEEAPTTEAAVAASQIDYIDFPPCGAGPFVGGYFFRVVTTSAGTLSVHTEFTDNGSGVGTEQYSTELRDPTCEVALACGINPTTEGWSPSDPFEVDVETGDHLFVVIHWLPPFSVIADLDWDFTFVVSFVSDGGGPPPPPPPPP